MTTQPAPAAKVSPSAALPARMRRSARVIVTPPLRQTVVRWFAKPGAEADRVGDRPRWQGETVRSVGTRRQSEALSASLNPTPRRQARRRGRTDNLPRLVAAVPRPSLAAEHEAQPPIR
jgi:hypothetical protein